MKGILATFWAESLKIRRSKMLWFTILAFLFIPMMMGLLMFVVKNPELRRLLQLTVKKLKPYVILLTVLLRLLVGPITVR